MEEFKVNDYITLKLEDGETNIYIYNREKDKYELFNQCKYVLIRKTVYELEDFLENIESVDELAEHLNNSLEYEPELIDIPAETRFWAHKSNMQVWAENNYDTRLLHSNLAFPLLKKLTDVGDPKAKAVFKEEIALRFSSKERNVKEYLLEENFIDYLAEDEILSFIKTGAEGLKELEKIIEKKIMITGEQNPYFRGPPNYAVRDGEIIKLDLRRCKFNELPEPIRKFKYLEELNLHLTGLECLPEWLGELSSLKVLLITHNKLMTLPKSIGNLKNLVKLEAYQNSINSLPDSIGELQSLSILKLSNNNLKDLPNSIGNLKSLKRLLITNNKLEKIPHSIGTLQLLEDLKLGKNCLNKLPYSIENLGSLKEISISNNPLYFNVENLINLPYLKRIYLDNTKIELSKVIIEKIEERKIYFVI